MKLEELYLTLVEAYHDARTSKYPHEKTVRGRSYSVSSEAEDIFASYLAKNLTEIDIIRIDQALTMSAAHPDIHKHKTFYPDLSVILNNELKCMLDLKLDMGWNRDGLYELCKKHQYVVELCAGNRVHYTVGKNRGDPERREIKCSEKLTYLVVLLSGGNQKQTKLKESLETAKSFSPKVEVFVLSEGVHPNDYKGSPSDVLERMCIHNDAALRMISKIESSL